MKPTALPHKYLRFAPAFMRNARGLSAAPLGNQGPLQAMAENRESPTRTHDPEDIRSEYAAVVEYHGSTVSSRFTIAGLYVAAIGFIAAAVLDKDAAWLTRAGGSALAWWLTACLWILELRSRALYTNLAHRGIEIEHRQWGLVGKEWYDGFFSRQYKEAPTAEADSLGVPEKPGWDRPKIAWMKKPLSEKVSRFISHSWGFDLLYAGSWLFWSIVLAVSLFHVVGEWLAP
jgi:hypothetical protein